MLKMLLAGILMLAAYSTTLAQTGPRSEARTPPDAQEMAARQTERLAQALQLDATQTKRVGEINLAYAERMQAARLAAREAGDREAARSSMQQLRNAQKTELKEVLTAEQFAQLESMEANRQEHRGAAGKGKRKRTKQG